MPASTPALNLAGAAPDGQPIYTVTRLNREARSVLEGSFASVWVQGEVSNLARPASGHLYFSLKDEQCQVRCALFRNRADLIGTRPENGMQVLVRAQVSIYEPRGDYQLIIEHLEPAGYGALQRAFEELKQRLFHEGLFDERHKQALPDLPRCVGVVTSPSGAAIRDVLTVLRRRAPFIRVIVYPVPVQGEGAAARIARMLRIADERAEADVLILARGGGSIEDLWAFNDEGLARAIFECRTPVVTGIGHEIDITIADFVADRRAATPSAAAELVSPDLQQLERHISNRAAQLVRHIRHRLATLGQNLAALSGRLPQPLRQLQFIAQRLDDLSLRMGRAAIQALQRRSTALRHLAALLAARNPLRPLVIRADQCRQLHHRLARAVQQQLDSCARDLRRLQQALVTVSPQATLDRGYAIVTRADTGVIVRDAALLDRGDEVRARFARGQAALTVARVTPAEQNDPPPDK
jgi:exodeoxyribonuclease VII large subunit